VERNNGCLKRNWGWRRTAGTLTSDLVGDLHRAPPFWEFKENIRTVIECILVV
jgi:hypothetical protein